MVQFKVLSTCNTMWEGRASTMILRKPIPGAPGRALRMQYVIEDNGAIACRYEDVDETSGTVVESLGTLDAFAPMFELSFAWPFERIGLVSGTEYNEQLSASVGTPGDLGIDGGTTRADRISYTASGLPSGLLLAPDGRLHGALASPLPADLASVTLYVHDASSGSVLQSKVVKTIRAPVWTTPASLAPVLVGSDMEPVQLGVQPPGNGGGAFAEFRLLWTSLDPASVTVSSTGLLTASLGEEGTHTVTVRAEYMDACRGYSDRTFGIECIQADEADLHVPVLDRTFGSSHFDVAAVTEPPFTLTPSGVTVIARVKAATHNQSHAYIFDMRIAGFPELAAYTNYMTFVYGWCETNRAWTEIRLGASHVTESWYVVATRFNAIEGQMQNAVYTADGAVEFQSSSKFSAAWPSPAPAITSLRVGSSLSAGMERAWQGSMSHFLLFDRFLDNSRCTIVAKSLMS